MTKKLDALSGLKRLRPDLYVNLAYCNFEKIEAFFYLACYVHGQHQWADTLLSVMDDPEDKEELVVRAWNIAYCRLGKRAVKKVTTPKAKKIFSRHEGIRGGFQETGINRLWLSIEENNLKGMPNDHVAIVIACTDDIARVPKHQIESFTDFSKEDLAVLYNHLVRGICNCIGCGCDDDHACFDEVAGDPCTWLRQDMATRTGVCSVCPEHLERFDRGDREIAVPVDQWGLGLVEGTTQSEMDETPSLAVEHSPSGFKEAGGLKAELHAINENGRLVYKDKNLRLYFGGPEELDEVEACIGQLAPSDSHSNGEFKTYHLRFSRDPQAKLYLTEYYIEH